MTKYDFFRRTCGELIDVVCMVRDAGVLEGFNVLGGVELRGFGRGVSNYTREGWVPPKSLAEGVEEKGGRSTGF